MSSGIHGGRTKQTLIDELRRDPVRTTKQLADAVKCSQSFVSIVAKEIGVSVGDEQHRNAMWLKKQMQKWGMSRCEVINLLITDARLQEEDESNGHA